MTTKSSSTMENNFGSPSEVTQMWDKIEREKAAGGYPWTHLQHNCSEEVWINPLKLPEDISRETIRRKDGTLPSDWFHLPSGAETPSVDELLRDSPEPELELLTTDTSFNTSTSEENLFQNKDASGSGKHTPAGRKTPSGRRTPICGKHRNRHRSTGSSPAPSIKSQNLQVTSPKSNHQRTLSQPGVPTSSPKTDNNGGYEPVGQGLARESQSVGKLPQGRPPDSELPTLPTDEDSDTADGCFPIRKARSRSRERKVKKSSAARSQSRDSRCSEHPYETPKLLPKSIEVQGKSKLKQEDLCLVEYGYEPIGRPVLTSNAERQISREDKADGCDDLVEVEKVLHLSRNSEKENTAQEAKEDKSIDLEKESKSFLDNLISRVKKLSKEDHKEMSDKVVLKETEESLNENKEEEMLSNAIKEVKEEEENALKIAKEEKLKLKKQAKEEEQRKLKLAKEEELKLRKKAQEEEQRNIKLAKEEEMRLKKVAKEAKQEEQRKLKLAKEEELKSKKETKELELRNLKLKKEAKEEEQKKLKLEKEEEIKLKKEEKEKEERILKAAKVEHQRKMKIAKEEELRLKKEAKEAKEEEQRKLKLAKEEDLRLKKDAKETKEEEQRKLKLAKEEELRLKKKANEAEERRLKIEKEEIDKRLKEAKKEEQELKKAEQKKKKEEKEKEKLSKIAEERQKKLQDEEKKMQMREEKGENLDGNGNQNPFGEEVDEDIRDTAKPQINKDKSEEPIYADEDLMQKSLRDKELQKDGAADQDTDIISVSGDKLTDNMALRPRSPGDAADKNYVSTVSNDEFNEFQQNGYHDEEDIDFTPQNGYLDPEDDAPMPSKGKKSGAPKVDLMGKIAAAGTAIKNARLPSPGEIKEGYLNSSFHKSLHQPLIVKAKVEKSDVQKARQTMTQEKTPLQLGNIESISDIPIPTIRKSKQTDNVDEEKEPSEFSMPKNMDDLGKAVLPKSFFEQNIVTAVKENIDPEELERNRTLTKTKTPAQLAEINSITEFPVPDKLKNLLSSSSKDKEVIPTESKKRRHSDIEPKVEEPFSMYSTLPKSWRETQLVTNVKVEEDEETLRARQDLVNSKSPSELAQITSFSDIPVPSRLSRMVSRNQSVHGSGSKSETRAPRDMSSDQMEVASSTKSMSKVNINDMYATLPKSLTMELAVACKVNANQEEVEKRKKLCQEKTPTELGNIGSLSDIPIPAPIQNLFSRPEAPSKPKRNSKDLTEKRKRNLTTGTVLPSNFLPESWKETKLLVRSRVIDDEEVLKSRQQLVENKTPAELAAISGLSDIPVPTRIQTLMRTKKRNLKSTEEKELSKKVSGSAKSLPDMSGFLSVPSSLRSELIVTAKIEDPEIVARNKEIIKNKSVSELSQIRGLEEFPIPDKIENLFKNQKPKPNPVKMSNSIYDNGVSETSSERPTSPQSFKDSIYGSLPRSMKEQQLLVKSKITDPEKVKERQELVRTKSPAELSQISSITDLPIPAPVENILKRKSEPGSPVAPPRKWKVDDIYESIPGSLKSELIVRSREMEDPEELEKRRELIRTQSPAQLSEINSLADLPIPKFIENKFASKPDSVKNEKTNNDEARDVPLSEKIYGTLPASLMETKLVVKAVCEDPEVQAARAEVVKSKSVNELSQVTSFADIPIPDAIENLMKKKPERNTLAPAERKKKFKDQMKAQSTQSLSQSLYGSLPRSLKQDLLVKARVEDPDILAERRAVVASKSVSELSQITSLSDIPVPSTLSRAFHKSMERLNGMKSEKPVDVNDSRPISPGARSIQENLYATLPKSLKSEILVKSVVEDPDRQLQNMALTQSKSVSELSQIKALSDFPIPENIEKLISRSATNNKTETPEQQSLADSRPISQASRRGMNDIYASLPRSLKDQLIVRTKVEENEEVLAQRQALVESKSPVELSEIHSLAELPIPSRIEAWLHGTTVASGENNDASPMTLPRNKKELHEAVYRTLPTSLVQPCVVRSKVEDPNILLERQQLQQTKSIHELSKIRNLNEMPVPGNMFQLPNVPLPKVKNLLNYIARPPQRSPRVQNGTRSETYHSYESAQSETPLSTPVTEDKPFLNDAERQDHDLGYETITGQKEMTPPPPPPPPAQEAEDDHFSLADQIRGTPERSLKGKKKKNRRSHEIHDDMIDAEDVPPPLPPKKLSPSPKKGLSIDDDEEVEAIPVKNKVRSFGDAGAQPLPPKRERQSGSHEPREITEKMSPQVEERAISPIQSRPLPAPPAPPRNLKKKSASVESPAEGRGSRNSDRSFGDFTQTENFRTCAETLNTSKTLRGHSSKEEDDITLAESVVDSLVSCAETLVGDNENLETCVETLRDEEFFSDDEFDNPYPSVNFDKAGANIMEEERPGRSMDKKRDVKKSESGRRLEEGTQQLSMELMHHVESLKTTLDNMSNRLGTRSRSRSQSKTRPSNNRDSL